MRTIKIYGASDDLFEVETDHRDGEPDEIGCSHQLAAVKIAAGEDAIIVHGRYNATPGCAAWMIGISQVDEEIPLPAWPMTWGVTGAGTGYPRHKVGYSVLLTIEAPDNAEITEILPGPDDDE